MGQAWVVNDVEATIILYRFPTFDSFLNFYGEFRQRLSSLQNGVVYVVNRGTVCSTKHAKKSVSFLLKFVALVINTIKFATLVKTKQTSSITSVPLLEQVAVGVQQPPSWHYSF